MALKLWLPLNGSLENKGISDPTIGLVGTPTVNNSGKIGKCYTFSGSNGVSVAQQILPSQTPAWSFTCWFSLANNTSSTAACFFSERTGQNAYGYAVFVYPNTGSMIVNDGVRWDASLSKFSANTWYHLAVTRDSSGKKIYINGELKTSTTTIGNTSAVNANGCLIGLAQKASDLTTGDQGFVGNLNDVRIYDHCLSAKEVKEIAQGLILHYKLNGFSGGAGENKLTNSSLKSKINNFPAVSTSYTQTFENIDGYDCFHIHSDNLNISSSLGWSVKDTINAYPVGTKFTFSAWIKTDNIVKGTTNYFASLYYGGNYNNNGTSTWIGEGARVVTNTSNTAYDLSGKGWTYCYIVSTFTRNDYTNMGAYYYLRDFTGDVYLRDFKFEVGDSPTPWTPTLAEIGIDTTKVTDSSGFGNDGDIVNTITTESVSAGGRYQFSTLLPASTSTYIINNNYLIQAQAVSFWLKLNDLNSGLNIFSDTNSNLCFIRSGNSSGSILAFNVYLQSYTGTSSDKANDFRISTTAINFSDWNFFVIEKTNGGNILIYINGVQYSPTGTTGQTSLGNGLIIGKSSRSFNISDFRLYSTELSGSDILDLYHTPANIDDLGGMHGFEFVEDNNNSISKNGVVHNGSISQYSALSYLKYDPNIYFEPDGSAWVHVYHHNHPDLASFASTDTFSTSVKKDDNRWFNATEVCNQLNEWEFLVKYCYTEGGTIYKERWIQTKNPEAAVFGDVDAADITRITGDGYKTGTWGGLYKKNGSAYWVMNNGTNGNWWGATGSFSIYQGGIPGYGGTITTTGYNDLYVRIDNIDFSDLANAKITANNLYLATNFIEK